MKTAGVLHADPPTLDAERAADVARSLFGVDSVSARPLVSERDQNFLVDEADGSRWVLKVSNAAEDPGVVAMEVAAVEHVARMDPDLPVPRARPTLDGDLVGSLADGTSKHLVRLLPFLPGRTAAPGELDADRRARHRAGDAPAWAWRCAASSIRRPVVRSSGTRSTCPTWCATPSWWRTPTGAGSSTACWSASWSERCPPCRHCGRRSSTTTSPWTTCCSTTAARCRGSSTSAT